LTQAAAKRGGTRSAGKGKGGKTTRAINGPKRTRPKSFGATGLFALIVGVGLLLIAHGNNAARESAESAQPLFWSGLVLIYTPIAFRLLSPSTSRTESLALSVLLGVGLYMVKILYNPVGFIPHDEMATLRQTWELLETGHFFSANPIVQGYAGYPGIEAVTAATAEISKLSPYVSAMIVIGAARAMLMLALFLFLERVSNSHRVAGFGVAVYVCNPSFLYFDSQYGYESLALAIAAAMLLLALRWTRLGGSERSANGPGLVAGMAILALTLVMTHHLTSYAMIAFLGTWALAIAYGNRSLARLRIPALGKKGSSKESARRWFDGPALPALFLAAAGAVWFTLVAGAVTSSELSGVFTESFSAIAHLITGQSGSKTLFEAGTEVTNTATARALGVASVIPLLIVIPFGLWRTWTKKDSSPIWRTLALVGLLYPVTLGMRLTQAGTETSQRASEFVFVGLAFLAGLLIIEAAGPDKPLRRTVRNLGIAVVATVVFLGGFIVGESPLTRQPGPYLIAGESRSVSPQILAAAEFADEHLPPHSRILVDRVNATLMAAFGHLDPVVGEINGIRVSHVFFSKTYDQEDQDVVSEDAIDYIVVDRRFAEKEPASGFYYEHDEPSGGKPISSEAIEKFAALEGLQRIYDNGAIAIYDTVALRSLP
jgi:hypothetical protein